MASKAGGSDRPRSAAAERAAQLRKQADRQEKRDSLLGKGAIAVAVLVAVGIIGAVVLVNRNQAEAAIPDGVSQDDAFVVGADEGADDGVSIRVVEDLQCPACQAFTAAAGDRLEELAAQDDTQVEYVTIAFLDRASQGNRYSSRAANAAACVWGQDPSLFSAYTKTLYENQPAEGTPGAPDDALLDLAAEVGADPTALEPCVADERHVSWIEDVTDRTLGSDGVDGTPTVFVDDVKVEFTQDPATGQTDYVGGLEDAVAAARA